MNTKILFKKVLLASAVVAFANPLISYANSSESNSKPQEIVISASRVEMPREASGSAISVIDESYMEQNQTRLVSDVLRDIPGVAVNRGGGSGSFTQVRIRGAESNQTLVLVDGIEVNDIANSSEFDFGSLLNMEIERVEVLRGAQSALWGSDAMGGVINIITKKGKGTLNGKLSLEGGTSFGNGIGTNQQSLNLNAGTDFYHYALSGVFFNTEGISDLNEKDGNREKDSFDNNSYNFKGGVKPLDNLSFDAVLRHFKAEKETDLFPFGSAPVDGNGLSRTDQDFIRVTSELGLLGGNWKHKWAVSANETKNEFFEDKALSFISKGKKKKYEYQTDYLLNADNTEHRFTFAAEKEDLDYFSKSISSFGTSIIERNTQNSGFVAEYGSNIEDTVYLSISGRRDLNDDFKNANTYRFTLAGWANENVRLHGSKGTGTKNPEFLQLFGFSPSFTGNPNLEPERNTTWDVGAEYHLDSVEGYIDVTLFKTEIDNLIQGLGNTAINLSKESKVQGLEFSARVESTENIRFNASYTFTDSDDGDGHELVRRSRHIASINSSYLLPNGKTRFTGGIQYNGKQDDDEFDAFFNSTRVTLDAFTLLNISVEHQYLSWLKVFARVENLTDKEYEEIVNNGTKGRSATVGVTMKGIF